MKLEKSLLVKKVAMKATAQPVVDFGSTVIPLETKRCFSMKTNKVLVPCSSQTTISDGRFTSKLLRHISCVHLAFAFNVGKAVRTYCSREGSELISFISEQSRNWKRRSEAVEEMGSRQEDRAMIVLSIPFLEHEIHSPYTRSLGSADQCLRKIVQHETCRRDWFSLSLTNQSAFQVLEIIRDSRTPKESLTETLVDCNSVRMRLGRDDIHSSSKRS